MEVKHKHVVDLTDRQTTVTMDAVQGDNGRILELEMLSAGEKWPLPEALAVKIRYQKPDGTGGIYDTLPDGTAAWSGEGNVLTVALAPEVCTAAGRVLLQIHLMQGQSQLTTFAMGLRVQPEVEAPQISGDYTNLSAWLETTGKKVMTEEERQKIEQLAETAAAFAETAAQADATLEAMRQQAENGAFDGKSAYEVAVEEGFQGTKGQWLESLIGQQGEKGDKGEKGDVGGIDTQFIAVYGETTNAEIEEAYQAGKQVLCFLPQDGLYVPLARRTSATNHEFIAFQNTLGCVRPYLVDNKWQRGSMSYVGIYTNSTLQGTLTLAGDPTKPLHAATKQYVDNYGARISTGTYVGTGKYGASDPNSLTFDFVPKLLIISRYGGETLGIINLVDATENYSDYANIITPFDNEAVTEYYRNRRIHAKVVDNTVYWYNTGGSSTTGHKFQCNDSNTTYAYMAIG